MSDARKTVEIDAHLRDTDRLEFFSDGVFAIAATLLVVELKAPHAHSLEGTTLLAALGQQWPSYLAFAASFLFIGISWAAHHDMFRYIRRTNHVLLMINLLFLMCIAAQPFSTALVAEYLGKPGERSAVLVYYGVLLMATLTYNAVWHYAIHFRLIEPHMDSRLQRALTKEHATAPLLPASAFVIAVWSVLFSLIPILVLYAYFAFPRATERFHAKHDARCA